METRQYNYNLHNLHNAHAQCKKVHSLICLTTAQKLCEKHAYSSIPHTTENLTEKSPLLYKYAST